MNRVGSATRMHSNSKCYFTIFKSMIFENFVRIKLRRVLEIYLAAACTFSFTVSRVSLSRTVV